MKQVTLNQPKYIADYNSHMDGVDKMDWLINKYRIKIRAKKWYFPLFMNMIDMAVVNAHVLYCMVNKKIPLLKFRRSIVRVYMKTSSVSDPKNSGLHHSTKIRYCVFQKKCEGASLDMHWNAQWRESKGNVLFAKTMFESNA